MKRFVKYVQILVLLFFVAVMCMGCAYMHIKTPYDMDLNKTKLGAKVGEATKRSVLWLVYWGDAGTAAAAKDGGLTTINHMDAEILSVLFGLYYQDTTIVYGD
jgi:hypothetical protein